MEPITILTAYTPNLDSLAEVVMPNRRNYCKKHGYKSLEYREDVRHGYWLQIHAIQKALKNHNNVMWLDLDIWITNPDTTIENWFQKDVDLITSQDAHGLNTGVIFVKKSDWSMEFIRKVATFQDYYGHWPCPVQTTIAYLLIVEPKCKWMIAEQAMFNSYDTSYYQYSPERKEKTANWQPGHFVLHLPCISSDKRIEIFKKIGT